MDEMIENIVLGLLSEEKQKFVDAKKLVSSIISQHYKESFPRNGEATKKVCLLRDKFITLCESNNPAERLAGLKGLSWINISEPFDEKIGVLIDLLFKLIIDDTGKIRQATANAFGSVRSGLYKERTVTDYIYAQLYLNLIKLMDAQTDVKKKKSIENLLGKLWCPHLETILIRQGYSEVKD